MQGKRAIVTGSASGIGQGVAQRFLDEGAAVAAVDLNAVGLQQWDSAVASGSAIRTFVVDISKRDQVESQLGAAIEWLGGCDVLVNAAGITSSADPLELTEEQWDRVMDVNVKGSFLCAQVAGRAMRAPISS